MFDKALLQLPSHLDAALSRKAHRGHSLPAGYAESLLAAAFGVRQEVLNQALLRLQPTSADAAVAPALHNVVAMSNVYSLNAVRPLRLVVQAAPSLFSGDLHE